MAGAWRGVRGHRIGGGSGDAELVGGLGGEAADGDVAGGLEVVGVGDGCLGGVDGRAHAARKETILRVVGGVVIADFAARAHEVDTSAAAVGVGGGAARVVVHGSKVRCRNAGRGTGGRAGSDAWVDSAPRMRRLYKKKA